MNNVNGAPAWRRSSRCGASGTCVEIAPLSTDNLVGARDAKRGESSPILAITQAGWRTFLEQVKNGSFDGPA